MRRWYLDPVRLALLSALLVSGVVFYPIWHAAQPPLSVNRCLSNVKQLGMGALMYAQDYDERMPLAREWLTVTTPYYKLESFTRCPDASGRYGYAFNSRLSRKVASVIADEFRARPNSGSLPAPSSEAEHPVKVVMLYDSTTDAPNATDPCASLPAPGRHQAGGATGNNISYLDGHAVFVRETTQLN